MFTYTNKNKMIYPQKVCIFFTFLFAININWGQQDIEIHTAKKIYCVNDSFDNVECFAVKNGIIQFTGSIDSAKNKFPNAKIIKHRGYIFPGFNDAHCHFLAYCRGTEELQLFGTTSKHDIRKKLKKFACKHRKRKWIIGRGWDQNIWPKNNFPTHSDLKGATEIPTCLSRVDGHAIWLNKAALESLNLNYDTTIVGGEILKLADGSPSGVFIDKAADWIQEIIPNMDEDLLIKALKCGTEDIIKAGITSISEAGLSFNQINFLHRMQELGILPIRINAMLSSSQENLNHISKGDLPKTEKLRVRSMKFYLDGALGSRGALLKHDYCDRIHHKGLQLMDANEFRYYANFLMQKNYQVCVHAIGDSANKIVIDAFTHTLVPDFDARWRIEHAQIVDLEDVKKLKNYSVIPSIQPTHATSDAPWAFDRICNSTDYYNPREGAYAYKTWLDSMGYVALGTDFPVEGISPIATFYSAVFRKDISGNLEQAFLPHQSLSRKQTLLGMTLWAARAEFTDNYKGSIETGKYADFVVLNKDIIEIEESKFKRVKVKHTFIGGEKVH